MSSFDDVRRNICKVVTGDGRLRGTAFFVLPDGYALTCHHVVFGLPEIWVQLPNESTLRPAEYSAERSNPEGDFAVFRVGGTLPPGLQLARSRQVQLAYGYGFRPGTTDVEPFGHAFAGRLNPGQALHLRPSAQVRASLVALGDSAKQPWNQLPDEYRTGQVLNFDLVQGVQQGISGGPVYDPGLRRVTGIYRAVEGEHLAYVLPLDSVFEKWRELEEDNNRAVRDSALDLLAGLGVGLVAAGAAPITPLVDHHLQEVFRDYPMFGGRVHELQALIDFARSDESGYFFVTGPPLGYGKTALLVALTRALADHEPPPVVHFLNRKYSDWLDRDRCLENLCLQLMKIYRLGGRVSDKAHALNVLYSELLKMAPAPGQRVVIILDGLDETIGLWEPDRLFPPDLPANVKVVFSAQSVADRDWLSYLRLRVPPKQVLQIEKLAASDVSDILLQSGIAMSDPATASAQLFELSGGDAFYLVELLRDLQESAGDLTQLAARSSASEYLRKWWDRIGEEAGQQAFYDLMGTLAVAAAALRADQLVDTSRHDDLKGQNIGRVINSAARYISGNDHDGYQLKHARIRRFVAETMHDTIRNYEESLVDFCLKWRDPGRTGSAMRYAVENGVRQLIEVKRIDCLQELLSAEFIAASWQHLHSFRGCIKDLSLAASAMYREQRSTAPQVVGLMVTRQTVRDTSSELPADVFAAWIRLGEVQRALTIADELTEVHGGAVPTLLTMAEELLRADHVGRALDGKTHADIATSLLQRALGLMPMIRMPVMRYELIEQLVGLVATSTVPSAQQKAQLAQQGIKWGESIADPIERSFVLGIASYLSAIGGDRSVAERALGMAEQAGARITLASDRLMLCAYRMQAIHELFPKELESRFPGFDAVTDSEATFPLTSASICGVVARKLADVGPAALPLLRELARQVAADIANRARDARHVVNALLRVGDLDEVFKLIDTAHSCPGQAFDVILGGIKHLERLRNVEDRTWWPQVLLRAEPQVLARAGNWPAALGRIQQIPSRGRGRSLIEVMRVIAADQGINGVPPDVWSSLTHLVEDVQTAERPECLSAAALAASAKPPLAKSFLDQAIRFVVARSTEGGAEQIQSLYSVALHQEGCYAEAAQVALGIDRLDIASDTLVALGEYTNADTDTLAIYAQGLLDCLARTEGSQTAGTRDKVSADALGFVRAHPDAGKTLYETIASRPATSLPIAVDLAVTACFLDPSLGFTRCTDVFEAIAKAPPPDQPNLLASLLNGLADVRRPETNDAGLARLVDRALGKIDLKDSQKLRLQTAKAALLVRHNPDEAIRLLRNALEVLAKPGQKSLGELAAIQFLIGSGSLFTGRPVGLKMDEADDTVRVWDAALLALDQRPDDALVVLEGVLKTVRQLRSPADETSALISIFKSTGCLRPAHREMIGKLIDKTIEQASSISRDDYQVMALQSAVRAFLVAGDITRAEQAEALIRSTKPFNSMKGIISAAKERTDQLSPVERHVIRLFSTQGVALLAAYYAPKDADKWPFVNTLIESMLEEQSFFDKSLTRQGALIVAFAFACVFHRIGGAEMIKLIINTIRDYDARFQKACAIISQTRPPQYAST